MQNEGKVVMAAVARKGSMLKYASFEMRDNVDIVAVAVANDPSAIRYVGQTLKEELKETPDLLAKGDPLAFGDVGASLTPPAPPEDSSPPAAAEVQTSDDAEHQ